MTIRERLEAHEQKLFSPRACLSIHSKGRKNDEAPCPFRTQFQRDRDKIIHSKAFRRLKRKTQVFLSPEGDHYRTRMTHVLEVMQIARTIARALSLNEDLTEAIALGHDLGHTPFGHAGEETLGKLYPEGFRHERHGVRIVDVIEDLNLTWEVKEGILKHSKGRGPLLSPDSKHKASTLEGQVVRIADIIAYLNHDIDDAIRAGVLAEKSIPKKISDYLGTTKSQRITKMISDVVESTAKFDDKTLTMSDSMTQAIDELRAFMFDNVYESFQVRGEFIKACRFLEDLYAFYLKNEDVLLREVGTLAVEKTDIHRIVCDYIAGMTDDYALSKFQEHIFPKIIATYK
ncbi:MAG: deoxyguanosinetriphosphate triphosphohydrolase [Deltaproteobacteria bacterium]|nr:deoxyguanosinetriphosphate triphosphohydrolase [Deltaproteobacteria bacterium]